MPWSSATPYNLRPQLLTLVYLNLGLILFGLGEALLIASGAGVSPWTVLAQGIAGKLGWSIGFSTMIVSFVVLVFWIPLRRKPGMGTILNALIIAFMIDFSLPLLPHPEFFTLAGVAGGAWGSGRWHRVGYLSDCQSGCRPQRWVDDRTASRHRITDCLDTDRARSQRRRGGLVPGWCRRPGHSTLRFWRGTLRCDRDPICAPVYVIGLGRHWHLLRDRDTRQLVKPNTGMRALLSLSLEIRLMEALISCKSDSA